MAHRERARGKTCSRSLDVAWTRRARHRRRRSAATVITCADRADGFTCQQARQREDIMDRRDFLQSTLAATAGAASAGATGAAAAVTDGEPSVRLAQAGAASMPAGVAEAAHHGPVTRRWVEQRWLLDNVIQANGIDWDQPRSIYWNVP